mmetsp:Transcript_14435/g.19797  ORF Transcript_14435/g.19797 Transcript_14435/m.19797 type:complete len:87 (-) Transcript_14435:338-598(-)
MSKFELYLSTLLVIPLVSYRPRLIIPFMRFICHLELELQTLFTLTVVKCGALITALLSGDPPTFTTLSYLIKAEHVPWDAVLTHCH